MRDELTMQVRDKNGSLGISVFCMEAAEQGKQSSVGPFFCYLLDFHVRSEQ